MTSSITPLEVLHNLNALGYKNITAIQLKEFMQDLKKLVKYNIRRDFESISSSLDSTPELIPHYLSYTTSSMAKQKETKHCKLKVSDLNSSSCISSINHHIDSTSTRSSIVEEAPKLPIASKFGSTSKRKCTNLKLKQTTFILPRPPKKMLKCDPVELYHKYKRGWKKQNFPGEADRADLRWAVREKLIGQPQVDI
ncbi:hypothetical protein FQR65_LT07485 [Abscondita terminalis]|nr:hypothetical protein FQR65_LT07485 [Abscondita terminalis]